MKVTVTCRTCKAAQVEYEVLKTRKTQSLRDRKEAHRFVHLNLRLCNIFTSESKTKLKGCSAKKQKKENKTKSKGGPTNKQKKMVCTNFLG